MVREVKPLTSVVPVPPRTSQRRGKLIDEVYDAAANADAGEQLSLEPALEPEQSQLVNECPHPDCHQPAKTTKKRTSTTSTSKSKTNTKTNNRTVSKAKRKNTSVSFTINDVVDDIAEDELAIVNHEETQSLTDLQQQIAELQARLSGLQEQEMTPTRQHPNTQPSNTASPRLPNWSEPELRPHTTLEEAQQAYQALEVGTAHRYPRPRHLTGANQGVSSFAESRSIATRLAEARLQQQQFSQSRVQRRRRKSHLRWDMQRFGQNLWRLMQQVLPMPPQPGAKVIDAIAWMIAAIGLRMVLKIIMLVIPAIAWPLNIVMALPALVAVYLAFCVENSRSDVIYRLLLITVGIFIGSRF